MCWWDHTKQFYCVTLSAWKGVVSFHIICVSWSSLLLPFPLNYPVPFPVTIWCESYLTAAASDCEGGILVYTFSRTLSRVFFTYFTSSLELIGAVSQALSRIMTCKWDEIVHIYQIKGDRETWRDESKALEQQNDVLWLSGELPAKTSSKLRWELMFV